jgi:hypothetical protein
MDINKVPRTDLSTLGMFIHVFTFERKVEVEEGERILKSGVKVGEKDHEPSPKKVKPNEWAAPGSNSNQGGKCRGKFSRMGARNNSQSQSEKMVASAPPKMGNGISGGSKLMGDAQKAFSAHINDIGIVDKVQILDNFEDSDTKCETLNDN